MNKLFVRIVAVLLVPCLLVDPLGASGLCAPPGRLRGHVSAPQAPFQEEALVSMAAGATRYVFGAIRNKNASIQRAASSEGEMSPLLRDLAESNMPAALFADAGIRPPKDWHDILHTRPRQEERRFRFVPYLVMGVSVAVFQWGVLFFAPHSWEPNFAAWFFIVGSIFLVLLGVITNDRFLTAHSELIDRFFEGPKEMGEYRNELEQQLADVVNPHSFEAEHAEAELTRVNKAIEAGEPSYLVLRSASPAENQEIRTIGNRYGFPYLYGLFVQILANTSLMGFGITHFSWHLLLSIASVLWLVYAWRLTTRWHRQHNADAAQTIKLMRKAILLTARPVEPRKNGPQIPQNGNPSSGDKPELSNIEKLAEAAGVTFPLDEPDASMTEFAPLVGRDDHKKMATDHREEVMKLYAEFLGTKGLDQRTLDDWYQNLITAAAENPSPEVIRVDEDWLRISMGALAQIEAVRQGHEPPTGRALWSLSKDWGIRVTHHPNQTGRCAFNHPIDWAFHLIHKPTERRIILGSGEVVSMGILPPGEDEKRQTEFRRANHQQNHAYPELAVCLALLRQEDLVRALLREPEFSHFPEGAEVLGFALASQIFPNWKGERLIGHSVLWRDGETVVQTPLSVKTMREILSVTRRLVDGGFKLSPPVWIPTLPMLVAQRLMPARVLAQCEDFSVWNQMAELVSDTVEQLRTFHVRLALVGRFAGTLADPYRKYGKSGGQIRRAASFGSSAAVKTRAFQRIAPELQKEAGFDLENMEFIQVDASKPLMKRGEEVMAERPWPGGGKVRIRSIEAVIGQKGALAAIKDRELDWAETRLVRHMDGDKALHFLLELNRVLDEGGYLTLTDMPEGVRDVLPRLGFHVVTEPDAQLSLSDESLHGLTDDMRWPMDRLRQHLSQAPYLIAVKIKSCTLSDFQSEEVPALVQALTKPAKTTPATEDNDSKEAATERRQPLEVPLFLNFSGFSKTDLLPSGISREEIADDKRYKEFDIRLVCLAWAAKESTDTKRRKRYLTADEVDRVNHLIELWDNPHEDVLSREVVDWVMVRTDKGMVLSGNGGTKSKNGRALPPPLDAVQIPAVKEPPPQNGDTLLLQYLAAETKTDGETFYDTFVKAHAAVKRRADKIDPRLPQEVRSTIRAMRELNQNKEANDRIQAEYVQQLVDAARAAGNDKAAMAAIRNLLMTSRAGLRDGKGHPPSEAVLRILKANGLLLKPVPAPPVVKKELLSSGVPTLADTPKPGESKDLASIAKSAEPSQAEVLQKVIGFFMGMIDTVSLDLKAWDDLSGLASRILAPIPEDLSHKMKWGADILARTNVPELVRTYALNESLRVLNQSYLKPLGRMIFLHIDPKQRAQVEPSVLAISVAPQDTYTVRLLAMVGKGPDGGFYDIPAETFPLSFCRTNEDIGDSINLQPSHDPVYRGRLETLAKEDYREIVGRWDLIERSAIPPRSVLGVDPSSAPQDLGWKDLLRMEVGKTPASGPIPTPAIENADLVHAFDSRTRDEGRLTRPSEIGDYLRAQYMQTRAYWVAMEQETRRHWLAKWMAFHRNGPSPSSELKSSVDDTPFVDAYIRPDGLLKVSVDHLPSDLRPPDMELARVFLGLNLLAEAKRPACHLLEHLMVAVAPRSNQNWDNRDTLLIFYLLGASLFPTREWDLARMLKSGRCPPGLVREVGRMLSNLSDDGIRSIFEALRHQNFLGRMHENENQVIQFELYDTNSEPIVDIILARDIARAVQTTFDKSGNLWDQWNPILARWSEQKLPVEKLRRALARLQGAEAAGVSEEARQVAVSPVVRLINEEYFFPRRAVLTVAGRGGRGLMYLQYDLKEFHVFEVKGLFQGTLYCIEQHIRRDPENEGPNYFDLPHIGLIYGKRVIPTPEGMDQKKEGPKNPRSKQRTDMPAPRPGGPHGRREALDEQWVKRTRMSSESESPFNDMRLFRFLIHSALTTEALTYRGSENPWEGDVSPVEYPRLTLILRLLRQTSSLRPIIKAVPKTAGSREIHENQAIFIGMLFASLHYIFKDPLPVFAAGFNRNLQEREPEGFRLMIYLFLRELRVLHNPALRDLTFEQIRGLLVADDLWLDISEEFLSQDEEALRSASDLILKEHFMLRFHVDMENRTLTAELMDPPASETAPEETTGHWQKALGEALAHPVAVEKFALDVFGQSTLPDDHPFVLAMKDQMPESSVEDQSFIRDAYLYSAQFLARLALDFAFGVPEGLGIVDLILIKHPETLAPFAAKLRAWAGSPETRAWLEKRAA